MLFMRRTKHEICDNLGIIHCANGDRARGYLKVESRAAQRRRDGHRRDLVRRALLRRALVYRNYMGASDSRARRIRLVDLSARASLDTGDEDSTNAC
jgi:hypothetical protein